MGRLGDGKRNNLSLLKFGGHGPPPLDLLLHMLCSLYSPLYMFFATLLTSLLSCRVSPTGDNGTMYFWDWRTGYNFQRLQATIQPGSLDSEAGIFEMTFDHSSSRLITCEADKTIKIYKEDEMAVRLCLISHNILT